MQPPKPNDSVARTGQRMAIAAVLGGVLLLTFLFNRALVRQNNPNTDVVSLTSGEVTEVRLNANHQGHYVVNGFINDVAVEFLLDTGATTVAVSEDIAHRAGLSRGPRISVSTANGDAMAYVTRLDAVRLAGIEMHDVLATINPGMDSGQVLLGMTFLGQLEMIQQGDTMTLRQRR